jgi:hypothetical protein
VHCSCRGDDGEIMHPQGSNHSFDRRNDLEADLEAWNRELDLSEWFDSVIVKLEEYLAKISAFQEEYGT